MTLPLVIGLTGIIYLGLSGPSDAVLSSDSEGER